MMTVADFASRSKNPYREEHYFTLNVRNGVLRSPLGVRMLAIPEELFQGLHAGLEDECGAAAPVVLYQCGKWWGRQFLKKQTLEVRHFFQEDLTALPIASFLHVMRKVFQLYGWGQLDVSFELRESGFLEARVENAFYSDAVGNVGRTTDDLMAGVLASVLGELAGRELECVETTCRSRGDQRCTFLIGIKPRVEIVSSWLKQGRNHAAIVEAVAKGEIA
jgi:uncharacterized protein